MDTHPKLHPPPPHLEGSTLSVVLEQIGLVQVGGSRVDEIRPPLLQQRIGSHLLLGDPVQLGVTQHADVQVSVACTKGEGGGRRKCGCQPHTHPGAHIFLSQHHSNSCVSVSHLAS